VALLLLQRNATITICHSKTQNLVGILQSADIIVAAVGRANFVKAEMVREGVILVDVGINRVQGKITGDIDPQAYTKAAAYTPVPGGVGTVCNLMVMETLTKKLPGEKGV
jgi:methylenetetrahydrofolate dehydrogenase (NADP+)/methenyltetrahydrofolate cyclohydrolase